MKGGGEECIVEDPASVLAQKSAERPKQPASSTGSFKREGKPEANKESFLNSLAITTGIFSFFLDFSPKTARTFAPLADVKLRRRRTFSTKWESPTLWPLVNI